MSGTAQEVSEGFDGGEEPEQTGLGPNDVRQGNLECERGLMYKGPGPSGQDGSAGGKTGGEDT